MVTTDLDPQLTFDTFVVGPANRLASAAARRAADSPGRSYNPLFIYSASGLGKSHILASIAHHSLRHDPGQRVVYKTIEGYLDELTQALESGRREDLRERYRELDVLLLDDVQFLTGQPEAQEMLLRTLDALGGSGSQIVLASDRPPAEIDGLDERLLSRFSGGLIVDIAAPEYETRVAIVRKKAEERGADLAPGVAEAIARIPWSNVRELGGALNRITAIQELEGRAVAPEDIADLLAPDRATAGDAQTAPEPLEPEEEWRRVLRTAAEEAEAEGFQAARLRRMLDSGEPPEDPEAVVRGFRSGLARLREIRTELEELGDPWPQTSAQVVRDPERLEDAEAFLVSVQERVRPFPPLPEGPSLEDLEKRLPPLGIRAARALVGGRKAEYNPLYLWSSEGGGARDLVDAAARHFAEERPEGVVALTSLVSFAEEFIDALGRGVAGAWRERWWSVDLLVVRDLERLAETERAQDEFFHLFEALKRRGSLCLFAADRPPSGIETIDERLRSRFEGGLVVEVESGRIGGVESPAPSAVRAPAGTAAAAAGGAGPAAEGGDAGTQGAPAPGTAPPPPEGGPPGDGSDDGGDDEEPDRWRPSPEKVVWEWPYVEERLVEELE